MGNATADDQQQNASHTPEAGNPRPTTQSNDETSEPADALPDGLLAPETVLAVFNRKYMLVKEAGKAIIYEPVYDPMLQRRYFDRLGIALCANRGVLLGYDDERKLIVKRAAEFYLRHPERRQYLGGVVFRPGQATPADTFNPSICGTASPSRRKFGLCPRLYDHLRDVICQSDAALFAWLLNWIARMLQQPAERAEVCVVIRGI